MDFATSYSLLRGYLVEDVIPLMMKEDDLYFFHNNKVASKVASIGIMAMTKENIHHCGLFFLRIHQQWGRHQSRFPWGTIFVDKANRQAC